MKYYARNWVKEQFDKIFVESIGKRLSVKKTNMLYECFNLWQLPNSYSLVLYKDKISELIEGVRTLTHLRARALISWIPLMHEIGMKSFHCV